MLPAEPAGGLVYIRATGIIECSNNVQQDEKNNAKNGHQYNYFILLLQYQAGEDILKCTASAGVKKLKQKELNPRQISTIRQPVFSRQYGKRLLIQLSFRLNLLIATHNDRRYNPVHHFRLHLYGRATILLLQF